MTTPSSPPISLKDVATELGVSSVGLSLGDSRVRNLAGVPSGPISLHQLLNRSSSFSPSIGGNQSASDGTGSHTFNLTCAENGGSAPYTYSWSASPLGGAGGGSFIGSTTSKTAQFQITDSTFSDVTSFSVQCTVTDSGSHVEASNQAVLAYERV